MDQTKKFEKTVPMSIGEIIIACLMTQKDGVEGKRQTNSEIVKIVKSQHKTAQTTNACVAWYVSALKKEEFRLKHGVDEASYEIAKTLKADKN
jgi:hypothetical protein